MNNEAIETSHVVQRGWIEQRDPQSQVYMKLY